MLKGIVCFVCLASIIPVHHVVPLFYGVSDLKKWFNLGLYLSQTIYILLRLGFHLIAMVVMIVG